MLNKSVNDLNHNNSRFNYIPINFIFKGKLYKNKIQSINDLPFRYKYCPRQGYDQSFQKLIIIWNRRV